jgi:cellulose biosynthesis protein BcsQ
MTGRVLACYNLKGGVGKTTAAVNLGYAAASSGRRVLLWDMDPQAAATFLFRIKPRVSGGGKGLLK